MPGSRVITYEQAVRGARQLFADTAALDMEELARRLAVSRATLYRVVTSRDRLLGDVLWGLGEATTRRAAQEAPGAGADRLLWTAARFNEQIVAYEPLRRLLREDAATAFRVLFMAEAGVHRRFVELWRHLIEEEVAAGAFSPALPVGELAFVFVRVGESMLYADLLSDLTPNLELAATVQRALLRSV